MYLSYIVAVSGPNLCLLSPECILIEPRSFASPSSVQLAMTPSTFQSFKSNASEAPLVHAHGHGHGPGTTALWVQTQLAVNSHNIQNHI